MRAVPVGRRSRNQGALKPLLDRRRDQVKDDGFFQMFEGSGGDQRAVGVGGGEQRARAGTRPWTRPTAFLTTF